MPTNIFRGDAANVAKIYKLTPGTPEPGDTFRVTINGKHVDFVAENSSVGDVVDGLVEAIAASTIPEFVEVTAAAVDSDDDGDSDYLTITAATAGVEVVLTVSTIDAGGFEIEVSEITAGDPGVNEIQRITIPEDTSGGTFTLTFQGQTTAAIAYNASAATLQAALEALSNIAPGDVVVGGASPTWTVEFDATYANTNVALMTGDGASLTGAASLAINTTTEGAPGINEIQSFNWTDHFQHGTIPSDELFRLEFGGEFTGSISIEAAASEVQTALEALSNIGAGNVLVSRSGGINAFTYTVEFIGALSGQDLQTMLVWDSALLQSLSCDVDQAGSATAVDEVQTVRINGSPTGGTFTLTFQGQTTAGIAFDATAATLEAALEALANIDDVLVSKSGTTYTITFSGTLSGTDVGQLTGSAASLTGGAVTVVTTQAATNPTNEVQRISFTQEPGGGTFTLTWDPGTGDETTGAIAYNASAATVQSALEALATPAPGDFSVTGPDGGPWLIEFAGTYAATDVAAISGDAALLTGGGSQSLTVTVDTASLGANHWNDPTNWTLGQVPETGDDVILESGTTSLLYGLRQIDTFTADAATDTCTTTTEHHFADGQKVRVSNSGGALPTGLAASTDYYVLNPTTFTFQLSATRGGSAIDLTTDGTGTQTIAVELASFTQHARFTGAIGLPLRNAAGYYEYRQRELLIGLLSTGNKKVKLGIGEGQGSGLMRFDFDTYQVDGLLRESSGGQETSTPAVLIENTHSSSTWLIESGEAGFAFHAGSTGQLGTLTQRGGSVVLGDGMTISSAIVRTAGELLSIGEVSINGTIEISG